MSTLSQLGLTPANGAPLCPIRLAPLAPTPSHGTVASEEIMKARNTRLSVGRTGQNGERSGTVPSSFFTEHDPLTPGSPPP